MLTLFPLDALDETRDVIESISEGFLTYSFTFKSSIFFLIRILPGKTTDRILILKVH